MSYDEIAYLDWTPDPGLGLRERALEAWEEKRKARDEERQRQVGELLIHAQRHISDVLDVVNATNVEVKPKEADGDGEVFCEIDGMQFKVGIVYPTGGGEKPTSVRLAVKTGNNWQGIESVVDLGRLLSKDVVRVKVNDEQVPDGA